MGSTLFYVSFAALLFYARTLAALRIAWRTYILGGLLWFERLLSAMKLTCSRCSASLEAPAVRSPTLQVCHTLAAYCGYVLTSASLQAKQENRLARAYAATLVPLLTLLLVVVVLVVAAARIPAYSAAAALSITLALLISLPPLLLVAHLLTSNSKALAVASKVAAAATGALAIAALLVLWFKLPARIDLERGLDDSVPPTASLLRCCCRSVCCSEYRQGWARCVHTHTRDQSRAVLKCHVSVVHVRANVLSSRHMHDHLQAI